ncbi:ADP-ribose 1''-phosphate phosphatase [Fusarium oxysporum f. sp. albedinis]|nr:ADP-ribose 1''-phosphate phosphatase [Fusarium oxysporum f. sp. albedinis]
MGARLTVQASDFLEGPRTIYYLPEKGRTVDRQRLRSMVIQQMAPDLISAFLFLLGFSTGAPPYNDATSFGLAGT